MISKLINRNNKQIPLFSALFDSHKYNKCKNRSATYKIHPKLQDDKYLKEMVENVMNYVKNNYDLEELK